MKFKKVVPAALVASALSFSGCSASDKDSNQVTYITDEEATYETIIDAAEGEQEKGTVDFLFNPSDNYAGVIDYNEDLIGITSYSPISEDNVHADVYFGELETDEFYSRVFNEYDVIRVGDYFSATKQDDGTYDVSYAALDSDKSSVYYLQSSPRDDNYYLPSEMQNSEVDDRVIMGYGNVSYDDAVEMFGDQIECSFNNISLDDTNSVKVKK